jgi:hypothetical protein
VTLSGEELIEYGQKGGLPTITLDSLFKYAVPAETHEIAFNYTWSQGNIRATVILPQVASHAEADTPALALFLALEKLAQ